MARRIVIAINGLARSGKDTVSQFGIHTARSHGWRGNSISSIDPIREMLRAQGVPVDRKGPEERRLLAEVKSAFDAYSWLATRLCSRAVRSWIDMVPQADALCFAHMREAAAIEKFGLLMGRDIEFYRLLVTSPRAEIVTSNAADMDVMNATYDLTIENDGTLEQLEIKTTALVSRLIKEDKHDDHLSHHDPAVTQRRSA